MSIVMKVIVSGWASAVAMFGLFGLDESGVLLEIRERIALGLETLASSVRPSAQGLESERESAI
jgi:hypothetical protein